MNPTLKIGLIALPVWARRAVPLPVRIGLCAFGLMTAALGSAEPLGRLFFTPEQRAQMEYSRLPDSGSGSSSRSLIVNGIVQQHGGRRTAWINGVPRQAGNSDELAPESLPVVVPGQSKPVKVKVGQKILIKPSADRGQ